jgi:uncharacterized protein YggU (UPF0235/DUF167 family)
MHIKVRVKTGAKNEKIEKISDTRFEISVHEKPELNAANLRVIALIAAQFHIAENSVRIVKGHHHPSKILSIPS